jgi:hypothetical protein
MGIYPPKKVYCKNCKYFDDWYTYGFVERIITCSSPQNSLIKHIWEEPIIEYKMKPFIRNKDNNCPYYRRIWYKFWV